MARLQIVQSGFVIGHPEHLRRDIQVVKALQVVERQVPGLGQDFHRQYQEEQDGREDLAGRARLVSPLYPGQPEAAKTIGDISLQRVLPRGRRLFARLAIHGGTGADLLGQWLPDPTELCAVDGHVPLLLGHLKQDSRTGATWASARIIVPTQPTAASTIPEDGIPAELEKALYELDQLPALTGDPLPLFERVRAHPDTTHKLQ